MGNSNVFLVIVTLLTSMAVINGQGSELLESSDLQDLMDSNNNYGWELRSVKRANDNGHGGNAMWFGPRLGRKRKRSTEYEDNNQHQQQQQQHRDRLTRILQSVKWEIVPIQGQDNPHSPSSQPSTTPGYSEASVHKWAAGSRRHGNTDKQRQVAFEGDSNDEAIAIASPFAPRSTRDHISPRLG